LKQKSWSGRSAALESKLQILQCDNAITKCNQAKAKTKQRQITKRKKPGTNCTLITIVNTTNS
jgi:hypothetical protein